jgi:hypothetical protein
VFSAVQTVLRMILRTLPPVFIIRIFPVSYVIRGCLSEFLDLINFGVVRLYYCNISQYHLFRFRFYSSLCMSHTNAQWP